MINHLNKRQWLAFTFVLIGVAILPLVVGNRFRLSLATTIGIYAILALSTNLLFGYMGLLALGLNAFFAVSAYAMVISQIRLGLPSELAILLTLLISAVLALATGIPVLRLKGHYFAMATLAFGIIVEALALRWSGLTGGSGGLNSPPLIVLGIDLSPNLYYVTAFCAIVIFLICHSLINSKIGRVLKSIRDDEIATRSIGIHVTYYKVVIFVLASVFSAVAGMLYAYHNRQVVPSLSGIHLVLQMLIMVVVGGIASNNGAVIGAVFVILLPQFLSGFERYRLFVFGLLILVIFIFAPQGLAGVIRSLWKALLRYLDFSGGQKESESELTEQKETSSVQREGP